MTTCSLNPRTIVHLHRVLHRAFEWAVDVDLIGANIFPRVRAPRVKDADTQALSLEEAGKFFEAARCSKFEMLPPHNDTCRTRFRSKG